MREGGREGGRERGREGGGRQAGREGEREEGKQGGGKESHSYHRCGSCCCWLIRDGSVVLWGLAMEEGEHPVLHPLQQPGAVSTDPHRKLCLVQPSLHLVHMQPLGTVCVCAREWVTVLLLNMCTVQMYKHSSTCLDHSKKCATDAKHSANNVCTDTLRRPRQTESDLLIHALLRHTAVNTQSSMQLCIV